MDIRIFSSMNSVIKDKIRLAREDVKVLELKKESLSDKVTMQENFIEELESRGKENVKQKENKIQELLIEENNLMNDNALIEEDVFKLNKDIETHRNSKINFHIEFKKSISQNRISARFLLHIPRLYLPLKVFTFKN